ncbi:MAG: hypothetical protein COA66_04500 [Arcobacter sp.]|nr:MAG: hypothetical protein COA66_04500 [Arcobacter sp.]
MKDSVNQLINLVEDGKVLEICNIFYDENVLMLNNGIIFAQNRNEAYLRYIVLETTIKKFDIELRSKKIVGNVSELIFNYKLTNINDLTHEFVGKHLQTWENLKIIREEYISM